MEIRTTIDINGARQNNLKNISVEIPRDKLTVITGVSGSGKSSLAFDVIYGEAQRRFLDSISNFAKSRIGQVKKPQVDTIKGLSPVIAIEQKKGNSNPRSTVGTVTDINDYIRLLFATIGKGRCPVCGHILEQKSAAQMAEHISSLPKGSVIELRAPIEKIYGEDYNYLFKTIRDKGYKKLIIDDNPYTLSKKEEIKLNEGKTYNIEIILDRFTIRQDSYMQIAKAIEAAMLSLSEDLLIKAEIISCSKEPKGFYKNFACPEHHYMLCEMQPFHFSFNTSASACNTCTGIGTSYVVEPRFLILNPEKSIMKGALASVAFNPSGKDSYRSAIVYSVALKYGFDLDVPFNTLSKEQRDVLLYGTKGEEVEMIQPPFAKKRNWIIGRKFPFGGIVNDLQNWYRGYVKKSMSSEVFEPEFIKEYMIERICPDCNGARLKKQRLSITINEKNIDDLNRMQIPELIEYLNSICIDDILEKDAAASIIYEIKVRLQLLLDIGLYYLNLGRRSDTISGGEMQRIKMSTQISSELMGMLYVMDEPSIGLHPRDSERVIQIMKRLRDTGNTVIVVEHDLETMQNADYLLEIGPGPGIHGGNIVAKGVPSEFIQTEESITAQYMSGRRNIEIPKLRRGLKSMEINIQGAKSNNLKNIDIDIPLGCFICVTGVSGSGKSTLINETLFKNMEILKKHARITAGEVDYIFGHDQINHVIGIDQSPIGRGNKSNPATYVGIYDRIRKLFAATDAAVNRGYVPLDFSLTHANGTRCEHCYGDGIITTNLQFMADIESICPVCKGARFSEEGIEIKYNGKSIADILEMSVEEALEFFYDDKYLKHKLSLMHELGLGYIKLGQRSSTLSGGESQRVKLSYELAKIKRGSHNLYILDEPTTGLHMWDIQKLLDCINRIVDSGHTVIVIEHNIDVIKCADHIIDLGPEGGKDGGRIVAQGTPEHVAEVEESYTGQYLKKALEVC